jgi:hypothetical protein
MSIFRLTTHATGEHDDETRKTLVRYTILVYYPCNPFAAPGKDGFNLLTDPSGYFES